MALIRSGREADYTFQVDGSPKDKLRVRAFEGYESVSRPFRFDIEIASMDGKVDFDSVVGKPAVLSIKGQGGERVVNGLVSRFEQVGLGKRFTHYRAEMVPSLWLLSLRSRCRVFQNLDVKEIIQKVLEGGGIAKDRIKFSLKGTYPKRELCMQYRESDLAFVSRLAEEEGIFYHFEHKKDGHTVIFLDAADTTTAMSGASEFPFVPTAGAAPKEEHILKFTRAQSVRTGAVRLQDFNYEKPSTSLESTSQADKETEYELYDYPGLYQEGSDGTRLAKTRVEELRADRAVGGGETSCRRMLPGYRFKMKDNPRDDFNGEYLLTRVRCSATQPQVEEEEAAQGEGASYLCRFECIPKDAAFRPERYTSKPAIRGVQTATVVGPQGEQIYTDDQGRAKIQFHWDLEGKKDENSSCWVRVSHGYAGPTHGMHFPPLVGDEVVVDFLEGDPDRPLIVGSVYNAESPPPAKAEQMIRNQFKTPYGHMFLMDDKKTKLVLLTPNFNGFMLRDTKDDATINEIIMQTADKHVIRLSKDDKLKGIGIQTEAKHTLLFVDDPEPHVRLQDKDDKLYLLLDTQNQTIHLINDNAGEINIKCESGTVNVNASEINLEAGGKINVKAGTEISMKAPNIKINADASLEAKSAQTKIEGSAQLEAKGTMAKFEGSGQAELKGAMVSIQGGLVKIN